MLIARSLRAAERLSEDLAAGQGKRGIRRRVPDSTLGDCLAAMSPQPVRAKIHTQVLAEHQQRAIDLKGCGGHMTSVSTPNDT